jgi:hypothetical protein
MLTPTQAFVAAAQDVRDITDASGRILTIRRPTTLDRLHLFKAVGPALSANERYLGLAMLAFAVMAVDGVPLPRPTSEAQIDAAVDRIGDDGIRAVADTLNTSGDEDLAAAGPGN